MRSNARGARREAKRLEQTFYSRRTLAAPGWRACGATAALRYRPENGGLALECEGRAPDDVVVTGVVLDAAYGALGGDGASGRVLNFRKSNPSKVGRGFQISCAYAFSSCFQQLLMFLISLH